MIFRILIAFFSYPVNPVDPVKVLRSAYKIIGPALEVHKGLGSGFLEAVYQEALGREFNDQEIPFKPQPVIRIIYKGKPLDKTYQPDYICYDEVIVEIKAISALTGLEEAHLINYPRQRDLKLDS